MKKIIVDRSMIPMLALDAENIPDCIYKKLGNYDTICFESGGASTLHESLSKNTKIKSLFYRVVKNDIPKLTKLDNQLLSEILCNLKKSHEVLSAIRDHRILSGIMSDSDDNMVGYVFRLLLISGNLNSDLLVWHTRYNLIKSTFISMNIKYKEDVNEGVLCMTSSPVFFPLDSNSHYKKRIIKIIAYQPSNLDMNSSKSKHHTDETPPINMSFIGPTIDIVAWYRYFKKKILNKN